MVVCAGEQVAARPCVCVCVSVGEETCALPLEEEVDAFLLEAGLARNFALIPIISLKGQRSRRLLTLSVWTPCSHCGDTAFRTQFPGRCFQDAAAFQLGSNRPAW